MVITRFAPSPTGHLHVGGIRTAIFNWAYARKNNGKFILRIDDTDKARHVDQAVGQIEKDFKWLGIDYDTMIYQSKRLDLYQKAINHLLDKKIAYKDNEGRVKFNVSEYTAHGNWTFHDLILGDIAPQIEDFSIARSDGSPLYNLATAVDDYAMGVTHVIRGQEHISNTVPQILIASALYEGNVPLVQYAHIPFICAPNSNKKLSKRDDVPAIVSAYQLKGYLPEAVFNYLSHLGWAMDAVSEKWTKEEFVQCFDFRGCNKKPSQFDPKKLYWLQGEYFKEVPIQEKAKTIVQKFHYDNSVEESEIKIEQILLAVGDRMKTYGEFNHYEHFIRGLFFNPSRKLLEEKITPHRDLYFNFYKVLEGYLGPWTADKLEEITKDYAADCDSAGMEKSFKHLIHALRAATTGQTVGFGVFDGMVILGKDLTLGRMKSSVNSFRECKWSM